VLFAVLERRVLQKRHRPPPDKTSGLSFDAAIYPQEYKNFHAKLQMSKQNEEKVGEKIYTVRPAGLKTRRSFSNTIITKNSCF
jgi:hypothetical protein